MDLEHRVDSLETKLADLRANVIMLVVALLMMALIMGVRPPRIPERR